MQMHKLELDKLVRSMMNVLTYCKLNSNKVSLKVTLWTFYGMGSEYPESDEFTSVEWLQNSTEGMQDTIGIIGISDDMT